VVAGKEERGLNPASEKTIGEERRCPPEEVGKMALIGTDGLLLVIILVAIAVVVIAGLWAIARIQKKSENLANILMILTVIAVGMLSSYLIMLAT
jgi:hypothetical protein